LNKLYFTFGDLLSNCYK